VSEPVVSLLMAAWNPRPDWLRVAVDTALDEHTVEVELVVVDDGSEPPVEELLAGAGDPRLRVVRVPHGGESAARNAGIREARGRFLRFVDADDATVRGSTARLLALAGTDGAIGYGATAICDAELRPAWTMTSRLQGRVERECLLGRFTVRVPSLLFPREVVVAAGDWRSGFRVSHDWDFVLRALEHAPVRGDTAPAALYRKHGASATSDLDAGLAGGRLVVDGYFERHPDQRGSSLERRAYARLDAHAARVLLTRGALGPGLAAAWAVLRRDPNALRVELAQSLPAVAGRLRRLSRRA
jgi:glycosyltransferase involved in cell wall biosynthesis